MRMTLSYTTSGTQAGGDAVIRPEFGFSDALQIDAETTTVPKAGQLQVLFTTPGMSRPKAFIGADMRPVVIDLTNPYPVSLTELNVEKIIFRPVGLDAGVTFTAAVVHRVEDAALNEDIEMLTDLVALGAASADQRGALISLHSYRLSCARISRKGVTDPSYPRGERPVIGIA